MAREFEKNLEAHGKHTEEILATLNEVHSLDPELFNQDIAQKLVELGAEFGARVTDIFGTPSKPKWASGTVETDVIMSYHNGGKDGHTSTGPEGAGVPRNVLLIAEAVNQAAHNQGRDEVFDPIMRAAAFYAGEAHDSDQLCGRALMPEGQGEDHGDERLSADAACATYLEAGGDPVIAQELHDYVMATAFNPQTGAQNVNYTKWHSDPTNHNLMRSVLCQELTAAADLLGPTTLRGPLGAIEFSIESLCLNQKNRILQKRLRTFDIEPTELGGDIKLLLTLVGQDEVLHKEFADTVSGQSTFFSEYLRYSDEAIRAACGQGIDDLFPGRIENADVLTKFAQRLYEGEQPVVIWQDARNLAGY